MSSKITYNDKSPFQNAPDIPEENKAMSSDFNEIKQVINANAENSYADNTEQIEKIFIEIELIKNRSNALEGAESPVGEEYTEYIPPSGAHDAYNTGDKITYNGTKYVCKMDGCVWSPEIYPSAWEEVL